MQAHNYAMAMGMPGPEDGAAMEIGGDAAPVVPAPDPDSDSSSSSSSSYS